MTSDLGDQGRIWGWVGIRIPCGKWQRRHGERVQEAWVHQSTCWVYCPPHRASSSYLPCARPPPASECGHLLCLLPVILHQDFLMACSLCRDAHRSSELLTVGPGYLPMPSRSCPVVSETSASCSCPLLFLSMPPCKSASYDDLWHSWLLPGDWHCHSHSGLLCHLLKGKTGPSLRLLQGSHHQGITSNNNCESGEFGEGQGSGTTYFCSQWLA